ncbi:mucin-5AC-like [Anneissia japonica]|uniref:mucin-5AC-like n=1 Tax=Anneissia japonica TaxID=1529436 RepID=UPI001425A9A5|nr:mucin-5AC-like [Anneissia japonica]
MLLWHAIPGLTLVWFILCSYGTAIEFVAEPLHTTVNYGDTVTLRCAVRDQGKIPVYWQNTDTQQYISMDRQIDPYMVFGNKTRERMSIAGDSRYGEYNLRIENVTNLDAGSYACLYSVVYEYYSRTAEIKVVNPPMDDYPMCMMSPATPAAIGNEVDLLCVSSGGKPAPMLIWTMGDTEITSVYVSGGVNGVTSNKHSLRVTEDDRGKVFTCKATHEAFKVPKTCSIIPIGFNIPVYLRPKIKDAVEGRRATFSCYTDKSLEPTFHWYLGNKLLDENDPRVTPTKDGVSKLKLRNLQINDNGTHVYCVITNRFGANKNDSALLLVFPSNVSADKSTGKEKVPKKETETFKNGHDESKKVTTSNHVTRSKLLFSSDGPEVAFVKSSIPSLSTKDVNTPVTTTPQPILHETKSRDTELNESRRITPEPNNVVDSAEHILTTQKDHNTFEWKPNKNSSRGTHTKQQSDVIEKVIYSSPTLKTETSYSLDKVDGIFSRGQQTNYFQTVDMVTDNQEERWKVTEVASLDEYISSTKSSYNFIASKLNSQNPVKTKTIPSSYATTIYNSNSYLEPSESQTEQNDEATTISVFSNILPIPTLITKAPTKPTSLEFSKSHTNDNKTMEPVNFTPKQHVNPTSNLFDELLNYSRSAPPLQLSENLTTEAKKSKSTSENVNFFQRESLNHEGDTATTLVPSLFGTDKSMTILNVTTDRKQISKNISQKIALNNGFEKLHSSVSSPLNKTVGSTQKSITEKLHKILHALTLKSSNTMTSNTTRSSANIMTTETSKVLMNSTYPNGLQTYIKNKLITEKSINNAEGSTSSSTLKYILKNSNTQSIRNKNNQSPNTRGMEGIRENMKTLTKTSQLHSIGNKLTSTPSTGKNLSVSDFPEEVISKELSTKGIVGSVATFYTTSLPRDQTDIPLSKIYNRTDKIVTALSGPTSNFATIFNSSGSLHNTMRTMLHKQVTKSEAVDSKKPYSNNFTTVKNYNEIKLKSMVTDSSYNQEEINTSPQPNTQTEYTLNVSTNSEKPRVSNVHETFAFTTIAPSDGNEMSTQTKITDWSTLKTSTRPEKTTIWSSRDRKITVTPAIDSNVQKSSTLFTSILETTPTKHFNENEPQFTAVQPTYELANLTDTSMSIFTSTFKLTDKHVTHIKPITAIVRKIILNSTMSTVSTKQLGDDKTTNSNLESTQSDIVNENKIISLNSVSTTLVKIPRSPSVVAESYKTVYVRPTFITRPTVGLLPFGGNGDSDKIPPVKPFRTENPARQSDIFESLPQNPITTHERPESSKPSKLPITSIFREGAVPIGNTVATLRIKTERSNESPIKPDDPLTSGDEEEENKETVRRNGKIIMASIVGMAVFSAFILTIFSILVKCCSSSDEPRYQPRRWS